MDGWTDGWTANKEPQGKGIVLPIYTFVRLVHVKECVLKQWLPQVAPVFEHKRLRSETEVVLRKSFPHIQLFG